MILLEKGGETWRCDYDKTEASEQQLADLRILREQTTPSYVILVDGSSGKELSLRDVSIANIEGGGSGVVGWFILGGVIGAGRAMDAQDRHTRDREYDKATQDKINETIRKKPRLYPYGKYKILMLCPRCREEVRSDQQYCEQCGAKLVMPIPRYAWI
jgi:hypothetical protein